MVSLSSARGDRNLRVSTSARHSACSAEEARTSAGVILILQISISAESGDIQIQSVLELNQELQVMAGAPVSGVAAEIYKDGRGYFSKKFSYARNFKDNYDKLTREANMLHARMKDVEAKINRNKMQRATNECEVWIRNVNVAEEEVKTLQGKYDREIEDASRFRFWSRANLSKQMAKKHEKLKALLEEGNLTNGILAEGPPVVIVKDAPKIDGMSSLHKALESILSSLRDENIKRIGLRGLVGSGKSAVMQNLNNNEEVRKRFHIVIWVSMSKTMIIKKMQDAITKRLELKVGDEAETAQLIADELRGTRYLLLLDEVWEHFDLSQIGITDHDKDSKVVFACRNGELCKEMQADVLVNLERLSPDDAFKMFKETVHLDTKDPKIIPIAKLVVKECVGLPRLINLVAKAFKYNDSIYSWEQDLENLRRWPDDRFQGMNEMLDFLRFCYDKLNSDYKKACFLYGALFPEDSDIFIDYLIECWKAEGFLPDEFQEARGKGHVILNNLIDGSLFEKSARKYHVQMNKVVRDMALHISDGMFLARPCKELTEAPNEEEWLPASRISLMGNDLRLLPESPNCTNLLTLLLQRNINLRTIPEEFFFFMPKLRVLDLHATAIRLLPRSLSSLSNLRVLYLNSCKFLSDLPPNINALMHVEVLDIRGTNIISLPGCLRQLRSLRMSSSNFDAENPIMISSLSLLKELMIDVDANPQWWSDQAARIATEQISTLMQLTSLKFSFPRVEYLGNFVRSSPMWKNPNFTFQFSVGACNSFNHLLDYFENHSCNSLKYANGEDVHHVISEVFKETNVLELFAHKTASCLSDFGTENMSQLRACSVEGCEHMEYIIDSDVAAPPAFTWLERMDIKNAPSLHCLWRGPVSVGSLGQMTSLTFYHCPKLTKIFSCGLIEQLSKLQHFSVKECYEIEEIISESENPSLNSGALPSLKKLVLRDLPKLKSITPDDSLIWPSMERVEIALCPILLKLPFSGNNAMNLTTIDAKQSWWSTLTWRDDATKQRLWSLCNFI